MSLEKNQYGIIKFYFKMEVGSLYISFYILFGISVHSKFFSNIAARKIYFGMENDRYQTFIYINAETLATVNT